MKKRKLSFDIARGIGIIFMIMNHTTLSSDIGIYDYINSFYMPLFFIVSGWFFTCSVPWKKYLLNKTKRLLVPYGIWAVIHLMIWLLMGKVGIELHITRKQAVLGVLWNNNEYFPIAGALWFLTALFFVSVLCKFMIEKKLIWLSVPILIVGLYVNPFLPFSINSALTGQFFFVVGYLIKKLFNEKNLFEGKKVLILIWLISLGINIGLYLINGSVNMRECSYGSFPIFFAFTGVFGSVSLICFSYLLDMTNENWFIEKINKVFAYTGKNSMCFLCLNQLVITVLQHLINSESILLKCLMTIVTLILLSVVNYVAGLLKMKWLFGEFESKTKAE